MKKKAIIIIRIFLFATGVILGMLYLGPTITLGVVNLGTLVGSILAALFIIYPIFFNKINSLIKKAFSIRSGKIILIFILVVLLCGFSYCGFVVGSILNNSNETQSINTNVVIVLGCQVRGDEPGPFLKGRINVAYEFLTKNENAVAILSGGKGNGENISEAQCMYNNLVDKGIDKDRLLIEDKSTSTYENFKYSKAILEENGLATDELVVVTNDFHEYRASLIAKKQGIKCYAKSSKTPTTGIATFYTREIFAVTAEYLK